ncbi:MAG: serine/threonine-protein phosphatase [Chromatiales bacterium]|jgi:protein phosphatase|nr:serine/threonine-protein phosphatase [Chromatiales bacterium]
MSSETVLNWISSIRTDVGMARKVNEDACLERSEVGLWAVADGMGGHAAGDVASGKIIDQLNAAEAGGDLSEAVTDIEARLIRVNGELRELAASKNISTIGSTVAALLIKGRFGMCLWAGDSRVYRVRDGQIKQMSQDHAFVEDLVEKGILTRKDAASHPQSNLVTRAVGAQEHLKLDIEIFELAHDDIFILCSDGLDKEVSEQEMAATALREDPEAISSELVNMALDRGARDNVTVATVTMRDPAGPSRKQPSKDIDEKIRELSAHDVDLEDVGSTTDFGRLARKQPAPLLLDDEDVTVRRPNVPSGDEAPKE